MGGTRVVTWIHDLSQRHVPQLRLRNETERGSSVDQSILWVSGKPGDGKSTLAKQIAESLGLQPFKTDHFVSTLHTWCPDPYIARLSQEYGTTRIGQLLDRLHKEDRAADIEKLMLDEKNGFVATGPLSIIEGYMPLNVQRRIAKALETHGLRVWIAMRRQHLGSFTRDRNLNWR